MWRRALTQLLVDAKQSTEKSFSILLKEEDDADYVVVVDVKEWVKENFYNARYDISPGILML